MFLVEDVRLACPMQLEANLKRKALLNSIKAKADALIKRGAAPSVKAVEIVEIPPVAESIMARRYQPGLASDIVRVACEVCGEEYHVEPRDILGRVRSAKIVKARHAAIYVLRKITFWSLPEIGRRIGGRDHSTILHALRKFERASEGSEIVQTIEKLKGNAIERLQASGVEVAVSPFGEQHVPEQQEVREGPSVVAGSQGMEDSGGMGNQVAASAEV